MSDQKTSGLSDITTVASGDLIPMVDVSDTTMAASGTNKKATVTELMQQAPVQSVAGRTGAVVIAESDVTSLTTDLAAKVPTSRTVNGHALSANVTVTADDVLPTQTGNSGKFLTTNGSTSSWGTPGGGGGGGGQWTLVTSGVLTNSSPTAITGLDGNTDGTYKIAFYGDAGSGNGTSFKIYLNNDSTITNYYYTLYKIDGSGATSSTWHNGDQDGFADGGNFRRFVQAEVVIHAKTGQRRLVTGTTYAVGDSNTLNSGASIKYDLWGHYVETSTNLTEIDIMNPFSASYADSYYRVYKLG